MNLTAPLRENNQFAFRGETVDRARLLSAAQKRRLLRARNQTGKSNEDALREYISIARDGAKSCYTAIDFPTGMNLAEACLYVEPHRILSDKNLPIHSPTGNDELRTALARLERYLACPTAEAHASFVWVEEVVLPDDSLVVWARDDDFSAAVLASRAFALWHTHIGDLLGALRSFPFPWAPGTTLNALSKTQEELRFALGRAVRSGDWEALETCLAAAYGWPQDMGEDELISSLQRVHAKRPAG